MPILGDATVVIARLARSTSNTLRVQLTTPDDTELAYAQQKGGVAVLLGYKNGGKSNYTLSNPAGDELRIAVGKTTTVTRQNTPIGKIVPADGAARFESGGGTVLAVVQPHQDQIRPGDRSPGLTQSRERDSLVQRDALLDKRSHHDHRSLRSCRVLLELFVEVSIRVP